MPTTCPGGSRRARPATVSRAASSRAGSSSTSGDTMAATPYVTRFPIAKLPNCTPASPCQPAPVCPACGGLECLCRPRFFAGQLLTEDDLNRLDDYVVAKNRLHNRYLVGWGVACGLEVVCSVCDPANA